MKIPERFPILLDGATGSQLLARGMPSDAVSELWAAEHPEALIDLQNEYVEAGSNIIYAPTFGANSPTLERKGVVGRTKELNRTLVEISKKAAAGRALVAGDLSPTGLQLPPFGTTDFEELYLAYREQAEALFEAGVDLMVVETLMSIGDARAALLAIRDVCDLPVFVSFTCSSTGRSIYGGNLTAALVTLQAMGISAFGINCFDDVDLLGKKLADFGACASVPLMAKPNASLPTLVDGQLQYRVSPAEFAKNTASLIHEGACILGGCCGTSPAHIAALRSQLPEELPFTAKEMPKLVASTERSICPLDPNTLNIAELSCTADLFENAADAMESGANAVRLVIRSETDVQILAEEQSLLALPLIVYADDAKLLERALRVYNGRAVYDSRDGLAPETEAFKRKYGLIVI